MGLGARVLDRAEAPAIALFLGDPLVMLGASAGGFMLECVKNAFASRGVHPGLGLVPGRDVVLAVCSGPGAERFVDGAGDGVEAFGRRQRHGQSFGGLRAVGKGAAAAFDRAGCPCVTPDCHWTGRRGGISSEG